MKKLITLLAILLFATNLYSSDWILIESISYEKPFPSDYKYENHSILSSTKESTFFIRNYITFTEIHHSTDVGISWSLKNKFETIHENNTFWNYFKYGIGYPFSFSPDNLIIGLKFEPPIGKVEVQGSWNGIGYGISNDFANSFNIYDFSINVGEDNESNIDYELLQMYDSNIGFSLGKADKLSYLILTDNSWQTLDTLRIPNTSKFYDANYLDKDNIVLIGNRKDAENNNGCFLLEYNMNEHTFNEIAEFSYRLNHINFVSKNLGFATVYSETENKSSIYKTIDGGLSWSIAYESDSHHFVEIDYTSTRIRFEFYDENNGIIPYLGGILMTRDGGETWTASPIETEVSTLNITATWVGSSIIADGRDGKLYRYQGDFFDIPLGTAEPAMPLCNTFDNELPVRLEWIPAGMATHYRMQVSKFEDFSEIELFEDAINNNYFAISQLDSGVKYFWRVQPYNSKEEGTWSESCSFTVVYPSSVTDGDSRFSVYPNPTRDILHIRTDELIARAELSDLLGNVVIRDLTPTLSKGEVVSLNVEGLPAGMYFLKLYTMSGEVLVEKVLVGF